MLFKKIIGLKGIIFVLGLLTVGSYSGNLFSSYDNPYGMNAWDFPSTVCTTWDNASIDRYRVMCSWGAYEPDRDQYNWSATYGNLNQALANAPSVGAKLSLCVFSSPDWARSDPNNEFSCAQDYADFVVALLDYCESQAPGVVEAVEIDNEAASGAWIESIPVTHGTEMRDPSQGYADCLKACYQAVKAKYPNVIVVMTGMWSGAYHILDDLYQLGCKGYFDKMNLHWYNINAEDSRGQMDPVVADPLNSSWGGNWHFPTAIKYLKYLAEENDDATRNLWITEFGYRFGPRDTMGPPANFPEFELVKSSFMHCVLDISRKSGFVELSHMYVGFTGWYPDRHDTMGLIYTQEWRTDDPGLFVMTTAYYMYQDMGNQYPTWSGTPGTVPVIQGASMGVNVNNPGFEKGTTEGWNGANIDNTVTHSGGYSGSQVAPNSIRTDFYSVQQDRLYEIIVWVKIDAATSRDFMMSLNVISQIDGGNMQWWSSANYWGVVDTRNYPDGWRRIRYFYSALGNEISVEFSGSGTGTFWVDDLIIKPLHFTSIPIIMVNPSTLDFGEVEIGAKGTLSFDIENVSGGTLSGTVSSDKKWIKVTPTSFSGNGVTVNVTVDNDILYEPSGEHSGTINITSNAGDAEVTVNLTATCVLVKPNPYDPTKGDLAFFGDGIVPKDTTIRIYTLDGKLVKTLGPVIPAEAGIQDIATVQWDGKNEEGEIVANGIYIYVYESPKEKGVGKITVIRK